MKIIEAITAVDAFKPNTYSEAEKIKWLSDLDGMIWRQIINTHEGGTEEPPTPYTEDTPVGTELIAGSPYEEVYIYYLESMIDYNNGEYAKYNNSITRFNDAFSTFANDYNRHHMPITKHFKFF